MTHFTLSSLVFFYQDLTNCEKKIVKCLFECEKIKRTGKWGEVFPSNQWISKRSNCSLRTVIRMNGRLKNKEDLTFLIQAKTRSKKWYGVDKGNTSNIYFFDKNFFKAMQWIEIHGGLNGDKKKQKKILSWAKKSEIEFVYEKPTILSPPPSSFDTLCRNIVNKEERSTGGGYINPKIMDLGGISPGCLSAFMNYSESIREMALEDVIWYKRKGNTIDNLGALLLSRCADVKRKYQQRN